MWERLKSKAVLKAVVVAVLVVLGAPQASVVAPMFVEMGCQLIEGCAP